LDRIPVIGTSVLIFGIKLAKNMPETANQAVTMQKIDFSVKMRNY